MDPADLTTEVLPHPEGGWRGEVRQGGRLLYATGRRKTRGEVERECRVFTANRCAPVTWGAPGWFEC